MDNTPSKTVRTEYRSHTWSPLGWMVPPFGVVFKQVSRLTSGPGRMKLSMQLLLG